MAKDALLRLADQHATALLQRLGGRAVSAGAKIPIVPFENSPPLGASGVTPTLGTRGGSNTCSGGKTWKRSASSNEKG
jgi:hypothetical protein